MLKLDMDKLYVVEIKEPKSKRSLEQNKMLWQLIHAIAKETHQDDMEVYCACLERADALHKPQWKQPITKANEPYHSVTKFIFE